MQRVEETSLPTPTTSALAPCISPFGAHLPQTPSQVAIDNLPFSKHTSLSCQGFNKCCLLYLNPLLFSLWFSLTSSMKPSLPLDRAHLKTAMASSSAHPAELQVQGPGTQGCDRPVLPSPPLPHGAPGWVLREGSCAQKVIVCALEGRDRQ